MKEFATRIAVDADFAAKWGDLGPVYGYQWRFWPGPNGPVDQLRDVLEGIRRNPDGRRHIVLTRDTAWEEEGAEVVHSVEDALKRANGPHVCIIGGAEIYELFLPLADRIELTEIDANPEGDASVPAFDMSIWEEIARAGHEAEGGAPAFDFVTLVRREAA